VRAARAPPPPPDPAFIAVAKAKAVAKVKAVAKAKACEQRYSQQIREQAYGFYHLSIAFLSPSFASCYLPLLILSASAGFLPAAPAQPAGSLV